MSDPSPYEAAVAAVRALHHPVFDNFGKTVCKTCRTYAPCPTERAIREHLGEKQ